MNRTLGVLNLATGIFDHRRYRRHDVVRKAEVLVDDILSMEVERSEWGKDVSVCQVR